jgi:hypothetical protein
MSRNAGFPFSTPRFRIPDSRAAHPGKKMLESYDQSRNVYENKQHVDNMPDEKSEIRVDVTRILQKCVEVTRVA